MMAALLKYTTLPISITSLMTAKEDTGMIAGNLIDMVSVSYTHLDVYKRQE